LKSTILAIAATAAVCLPAGAFGAQRYLISSPNQIKPGTITMRNLSPSVRAAIAQHATAPAVETTAPASSSVIPEGTSVVGSTVQAGTYSSTGADCYWARLSGFGGTLDEIIANGNGPSIVAIAPTDIGFHSERCGWTKIG